MLIELFEGRVPGVTGRIIELAESGYYDGLIFHRVIPGFMIQGGSSDGFGSAGSGITFDDEFHPELQHTGSRVLSMAKSSNDDTNDSQFFITAVPTRWLDFNHSIFGYLTEGDDVREAIAAVETLSERPVEDVVIGSATVEIDEENGVLMLSAPEGTSGEADVTVTVSDGTYTTQRTFHVTIEPDTYNNSPFLTPIDDVHTTVDTLVPLTLASIDVEGDAPTYGYALRENSPLDVTINGTTGELTITPTGGVMGVYDILVGVSGNAWDTQWVPVFVHPDAPTGLELLPAFDTGDPGDGITTLNNSPGQALGFQLDGLIPGADVEIFADGQLIGSATANGVSMAVVTDGNLTLDGGPHSITARQILSNLEVHVGNRSELIDLDSVYSVAVDLVVELVGLTGEAAAAELAWLSDLDRPPPQLSAQRPSLPAALKDAAAGAIDHLLATYWPE
ncbi:MAG: peptidylprolyl isomerase [Candidatus Nealsonbacteria bacterium]|nr:peptidylprolyl isomerase [Candidatus Nealsonbacteria bacterium]